MRVIAGSAGGIRLEVPRTDLRPTMDRVKAAIFSMLGEKVIGARVLDLFAGTGGLGLEALSRGAGEALFVEENRQAVAMIERNLLKTKLEGRVRKQDVFNFLETTKLTGAYDLVFADPPYEHKSESEPFTKRLLQDPALAQCLAPEGIFVLEKRPSETMPTTPLWEIIRARAYGATEVLLLRQLGGGPSAG